jgi:receptor protein-tyrosine kinase
MRERADRSIQAPGEAALSLGVPELGVIPSLGAEQSRYFAYYQKGKGPRRAELKNSEGPPQIELITSRRNQSVLADCFRATVTSILYAGENGDRPRVIVLTSANPGEGKTTVASNLALALAEIGRPVLLIDGDLRKGRLHEIFKVSNAWGFSDLLGGKELPVGREKAFVGTGFPRLSLLPTGSPDSSIASLLHSPRALEFLNRMREEFHTVIIDSPPMLQMADARVLGKAADAVVLVVHSAQTTRDEAATAAQRLTEDGTRVLGSILNEWDPRKSSPSGYGSAYRSYQYDASRG